MTDDRPVGSIQRRFERALSASRLMALIPVVFLMLDAAGSFIYGTDILLRTASGDIREPAHIGGRLGVFLVVMDTFLVGATLMVAAFGFYELFVIRRERSSHRTWLPGWLQIHDLEDLKARVVSMLILVAAITFVDRLVETRDEPGVLYLGIGIAIVIGGLTAFLRWGRHGTTVPATAPDAVAAVASGHDREEDQDVAERSPPGEPAKPEAGPRSRVIAMLGSARRDGSFPAGAPAEVIALAGRARIDLRDADLPDGRLALRVTAVLGVVSVTVPPGMTVSDHGLTLLGLRHTTSSKTSPGNSVLVLTGTCALGVLRVRVMPAANTAGTLLLP